MMRFVLGKTDVDSYKPDLAFYYPVNFKKIIRKTIDNFELNTKNSKSDLNPVDIIDKLEKLINDCHINGQKYYYGNSSI